jgi:hypothetical protein
LDRWLRDTKGELRQASGKIADRLASARAAAPSSASVYWLWLALAEAWAALCKPDLGKLRRMGNFSEEDCERIQSTVTGVDADLVEETGFNLFRYRRSELLDLDHLSPPSPV